MPATPRLASTVSPDRGAASRSTSRTGVDEPSTSSAPSGRAATRSRASDPAVRAGSASSTPSTAVPTRSAAAHHAARQAGSAGAPGAGRAPTRVVDRPASGQRGAAGTVPTRTVGSASSADTGRDSVGRPTTSTRSGRCSASQPGTPSSRAPARTDAGHAPLEGSATTGQPCAPASSAAARPSAGGASPTRTRVRPGLASAGGAGAGTEPVVHGAPPGRPAHGPVGRRSASSGSSGSRNGRVRGTGPRAPGGAPRGTSSDLATTERPEGVFPPPRAGPGAPAPRA